MPLPKRRHSHARTNKRRTHHKAVMPEIQVVNTSEGEKVIQRHMASEDGIYKGRLLPGFKTESNS